MQTVQTVPVESRMTKDRAKTLKGLGIAVVVMGLLMIILDAVAVAEASQLSLPSAASLYYTGIWGGVLYLIAGVMGILAGVKRKKKSLASFSIATSIVAAIAGFVASIILAWAAVACSLTGLFLGSSSCSYIIYVMHSVCSSISFINFIVAIILSTFSCGGGCCGGQQATTTVTTVYGNPAMQPQYGQPVATAPPQYGQAGFSVAQPQYGQPATTVQY